MKYFTKKEIVYHLSEIKKLYENDLITLENNYQELLKSKFSLFDKLFKKQKLKDMMFQMVMINQLKKTEIMFEKAVLTSVLSRLEKWEKDGNDPDKFPLMYENAKSISNHAEYVEELMNDSS